MVDIRAVVDSCEHLFLSEIEELDYNGLRLVVAEGRPDGNVEPFRVGDVQLSGGTRIRTAEDSRAFEIVWSTYVAYSVLNESFAAPDDHEHYTGKRFRIYTRSRFIDYVSRASFVSDEFPGPTRHYAVLCENHVVDVVSTDSPRLLQIR